MYLNLVRLSDTPPPTTVRKFVVPVPRRRRYQQQRNPFAHTIAEANIRFACTIILLRSPQVRWCNTGVRYRAYVSFDRWCSHTEYCPVTNSASFLRCYVRMLTASQHNSALTPTQVLCDTTIIKERALANIATSFQQTVKVATQF